MRALAAVAVVLVVAGCSASPEPEPEPSASPAVVSEIEALGRELCDLLGEDDPSGVEYLDVIDRAASLVGAEDERFGVGETLLEVYCPEFG